MPALMIVKRQDPAAVEALMRALPEWFGIEASIQDYVESARQLPTYLATQDGKTLGCVLIREHFPNAAEVYLMAVHPARHRQGIGRRLLLAVEEDLDKAGVQWLQVKTLGPSRPNEPYARTRAFYSAYGFEPLEEFLELWDEGNPCLLMIKEVRGRTHLADH